uniref:Cellulase n=1 Tax=Streptomyces sp. NBC_00049 TaxID=2903617 RepID=A0AAU2K354_9ACTN
MPESHDPLRSLFQEAASVAQSSSALAPVSVITRRGERARRRRIAGIALACCLVIAGSGAVLADFAARDTGPVLPASTPSPLAPSSAPPAPVNTTETPAPPGMSARPPRSTPSASASASATSTSAPTSLPTSTFTSSATASTLPR